MNINVANLVSHLTEEPLKLNGRLALRIARHLDGKGVIVPVECYAVIRHGPGHQRVSRCQVREPHDVHRTTETGVALEWEDDEAMTGAFNESPLQ